MCFEIQDSKLKISDSTKYYKVIYSFNKTTTKEKEMPQNYKKIKYIIKINKIMEKTILEILLKTI